MDTHKRVESGIYIHLTQNGQIFVVRGDTGEEKWTTLSELKELLKKIKKAGGALLYSRENPQDEPSIFIKEIFDEITQYQMPIKIVEQHPRAHLKPALTSDPVSMKYKKEWADERGYCNCLLVAMSRIPISAIELNSNFDLPNLEQLTFSRKDTYEWIRAQEFHYATLDLRKVIDIFWCLVGISRFFMFGSSKSGKISIVDCVNDYETVKRVFNLKLVKSNEAMSLVISYK